MDSEHSEPAEIEVVVEATLTGRTTRRRARLAASPAQTLAGALAPLGVHAHGVPVCVDGAAFDSSSRVRAAGVRRGSLLSVAESFASDCTDGPIESTSTWQLDVLTGPRSGTTIDVGCGVTVIGRRDLDDASVSAKHLAMHVDAHGRLLVQDLGSTNGTWLNGEGLDAAWVPVGDGDAANVLRAGAVLARARRVSGRANATRPLGPVGPDGRTPFRPGPRIDAELNLPVLRVPADPPPAGGQRVRITMFVVPLLFAAVMVSVTKQLTFALFALLSPLSMAASAVEDRLRRRRGRRAGAVGRSEAIEQLRRDAAVAVRIETLRRHDATPACAPLRAVAEQAATGLWARSSGHADASTVVVGFGAQRWTPPIVGETTDAQITAILNAASVLQDVPVTIDLVPGRVVGLCGDRNTTLGLARSIVVQTAVHRRPADVAIAVPSGPEWDWAQWLPHCAPSGESPMRLVVSEGSTPVSGTEVCSIVIASSRGLLPPQCGLVVEATSTSLLICELSGRHQRDDVAASGISADLADGIARSLAPYVDPESSHPDAALPTSVRLFELTSASTVCERTWTRSDSTSLAAPIGVVANATDPRFVLDLVRDGPHALVAGTTGAGKSELLRTWIASLAAHHRPEALNFLLVDYKGGSAFAECALLPHTAGIVTDLDGHLAARALRCLDAEIVRRETLLRHASALDLPAYVRGGGTLPRLVVVVDEFATLAAELPGFLDALVSVAQRGRSLGIHLVLATQRPAGAVSENIRANTNIRIALRVQTAADSTDVLGDASAASLPRACPGRALVRLGPGELTTVQIAYAGERRSAASTRRSSWFDEPESTAVRVDEGTPTELALVVEQAQATATALACATPFRPWPDPLPRTVDPDVACAPDGGVVFGVADVPERQCHEPAVWMPSTGPLLVVGSLGSGVTTALATVAAAAVNAVGPSQRHLHIVDFGSGALLGLARLPHVGDAVGMADTERLRRLSRWLSAETDRRRQMLRETGAARWVELVDGPPQIMLLIDQFATLRQQLDGPVGDAILGPLLRCITDGIDLGITAVVGVDRIQAIPSSVVGSFAHRIVLGARDRHEVAMALGLRVEEVPPPLPGRGIDGMTGHEVQIARPPTLLPADEPPADRRPHRSPTLPALLSDDELRAVGGQHLAIPVGLGDNDVEPVGFDPGPGDSILIAGTARSGRTSALHLLAGAARERRAVVTLSPRRPFDIAGAIAATTADDAVRLIRESFASDERVLFVVDDADAVDDPSRNLDKLLTERPPGLLTIAAGRTDALRSAYGHWTTTIRRGRTGLILRPNVDTDGDLFTTQLPRRLGPFGPGRALLLRDGDVEMVQVALAA